MPLPWMRRKTKPNNTIMMIRPYKSGNTWLFDDASLGINREAFVAGMSEIMDQVVLDAGLVGPELGFTCFFSSIKFPTAQGMLVLCKDQEGATGGSAWYRLNGTKMQGWLCPCLLNYFPEPPEFIYYAAEE